MIQPTRIDLQASRSASFEEPFEMMEACHERVLRTLRLLARLREHLQSHGADAQARQAAGDVMRYFDLAAPEHHRDEEMHVFPALLEQADPQILQAVARLRQDHLQMEAGWRRARAVLDSVARGRIERLSAQDGDALDAFASLYGEHIEIEERQVYPAARGVIERPSLQAMGQEMQRRRMERG